MKPRLTGRTLLAMTAAAGLLAGCVTTLNTDAVERTNAALEKLDHTPGPAPPGRYHDQTIRLWQDQPQYAALVDAPPPAKRMRLISAVAPAYPPLLRLGHVNARVVVSFVVGPDGHVEAARVIESSDARFNDSSLTAIFGFTFIPPQGISGPAHELATLPFNFWWSPKAHPNDSSPDHASTPTSEN